MQFKHYHFDTIDSTNNWAKAHVHEFDKKELTYITADFQSAGRGRFNRSWISPPRENLLATYVLWLGQFDFNLPQVLALAVTDMLQNRGFDVTIKWPNDLVLNGKKLAGILSESIEVENGRWMILGIGLNVNVKEDALKLIDKPATSLFNESGIQYDPEDLGRVLATFFLRSVEYYHSFGPFYERFKERLIHKKGDYLRVGNFEGTFKDFNTDGSITLTLPTGEDKIFISGEIIE